MIPTNGDLATIAAWKFKLLDLERARVSRMKVLTWNLNNRRQASLDQTDFVIHREPNIVVLTEVHPSRIDLWREALKGYDVAQTTSISERPRTVLLAAKGGRGGLLFAAVSAHAKCDFTLEQFGDVGIVIILEGMECPPNRPEADDSYRSSQRREGA